MDRKLDNIRRKLESPMQTQILSLNDWAGIIDDINELKGWNEKEKSQGDWAALAMSEIIEAYEAHRDNKGPREFWRDESGKPEGMPIEYADALIRILHWFRQHDLDPTFYVARKLLYNTTRPHRHGGKRV